MPFSGTRRDIVKAAAIASALAAPASAKIKRVKNMLIINALGGLENPNLSLTRPQSDNPVDLTAPDVDDRALRDAHAAGVAAVNVTLGYVGGPDEPFEYTIRS